MSHPRTGRTLLAGALAAVAVLTAACTGGSTPSATTSATATSSATPSAGTPSTTTSATPDPATSASPSSSGSAVPRGSDYLALGDSVSFGFREANSRPAPDYADASDFVGFPELVAAALHLHVANASCPGETSSSLIDSSAPSYGCERDAAGSAAGGYRPNHPLHVDYAGSQLAYGVRYLRAHPTTGLVTLMIGANDAFRCAATTSDHCTSELTSLLERVTSNVRTILQAVRGRAGYTGRVVLVTYYASDYSGLEAAASSTLDQAVRAGAAGSHVLVADGFGAFERVARRAAGDSCRAGLLTTLTTGGCGIHPSAAGQRALAGAVEQALAG